MAEITYAHINQQGELVILLSDDRAINVGKVVGPAGRTGDQGNPGVPGPAGADGRTIHSFTGSPDPAVGESGDYAIDHFNWIIYGPKAGLSWGLGQPLLASVRNGLPSGSGIGGGGSPSGPLESHLPKLVELLDIDHTAAPSLGEVPIWRYAPGAEASAKFVFGSPNAHIKAWDSTTHYAGGECIFYQGRIWRSIRDNINVEPLLSPGKTTLYIDVPGEPTFGIVPLAIGTTDPPAGDLPAAAFRYRYYLKYIDDHQAEVWKFVVKGIDPSTHKPFGVWEGRPWISIVWRSNVPPPMPMPLGVVSIWIYGDPDNTNTPVVGQDGWAPLEMGHYLSASADVEIVHPQDWSMLRYDAASHKWVEVRLADLKAKLATLP